MDEVKVQLKAGEVTLRKPTAGIRNKALIKADMPDGFKRSVMLVELLPMCIANHPWGIQPLKQALENVEVWEYDFLIDKIEELMKVDEETKKKLQIPLIPEKKENIGE